MSKQMKVTISPLGIPKVEMIGYQGIGCQERSKRTLDALGGGGDVELKPEANMIDTNSEDQEEMHL